MGDTSAATQVVLTKEIYQLTGIKRAVEDFGKRLRVVIVQEDKHGVVITITGPTGGAPDDQLAREFLNQVLEFSILAQIREPEGVPSRAEALPRR